MEGGRDPTGRDQDQGCSRLAGWLADDSTAQQAAGRKSRALRRQGTTTCPAPKQEVQAGKQAGGSPLEQLEGMTPARSPHGCWVPLHRHHWRAAGALQQGRKALEDKALPAIGCRARAGRQARAGLPRVSARPGKSGRGSKQTQLPQTQTQPPRRTTARQQFATSHTHTHAPTVATSHSHTHTHTRT